VALKIANTVVVANASTNILVDTTSSSLQIGGTFTGEDDPGYSFGGQKFLTLSNQFFESATFSNGSILTVSPSVQLNHFLGTVAGYIVGGNPGPDPNASPAQRDGVLKVNFVNDSSTSAPWLGPDMISPVGPTPAGGNKTQTAAVSSESHIYFSSLNTVAPAPNPTVAVSYTAEDMHKIQFSGEFGVQGVGVLKTGANLRGGIGVQSVNHGYNYKPEGGTYVPFPNNPLGVGPTDPQFPITNKIYKFPFASDFHGVATVIGDVSIGVPNPTAAGHDNQKSHASVNHAYITGNVPPNDPQAPYQVAKFPFTSDVSSVLAFDHASSQVKHAGNSSENHGYLSGGSTIPNNTAGGQNIISKFSFTSDVNAVDIADLTVSSTKNTGFNSTTHAYVAHGDDPPQSIGPPAFFVFRTADKFPFASDVNAVSGTGKFVTTSGHGVQD